MPRPTPKVELLARFEEAVRSGGWTVLYVSTPGVHPALYLMTKGGQGGLVKVYIWNISPGGKNRPAGEYRIQATGFEEFQPEANGRTLVLGWWEEVDVFAGWDIRQHLGPLGKSSSMQISEDALRGALLTGFAPYLNQKGETAIAFRPDFAGTYVHFLAQLHDSGAIPAEAEVLEKLSEDPDDVSDEDIDDQVDETRKYAVRATKRALRANDFSRRVLGAYGHQCAMCKTQLRLIDGAHILPVEVSGSTDETRNGIALCALHHRAYDRGLLTFDNLSKVHVNETAVKLLKAEDRAGGLKEFRSGLRPLITVPPDKKDRPAASFVNEANKLRGWSL